MVRIISPKGQMLCVEEIQPVCEMQLLFNGRKITIMESARDWSAGPTALAMQIRHQEEMVVGNLKPETVREIVRTLGEKEYFDFSVLAYQEAETLEKVVLDNGESAAYSSCMLEDGIWKDFCSGSLCEMMPIGRGGVWTDPSVPVVDAGSDRLNWESMRIG